MPSSSESAQSTSNSKAKSKANDPPQNIISFVSFDGADNEANRKAVRKQAALASAAARKATIAKKVAKQRQERAKDVEKVGSMRRDGEQERSSSRGTTFASDVQTLPTSRKRKQVTEQTRDLVNERGITRIPLTEYQRQLPQHKKQYQRTSVRYLTPPSSDSENETPRLAHHADAPCFCPTCAAKGDSDAPAHGFRRQFSAIVAQHGQQFLQEYREHFLASPLSPESLPSPKSIAIQKADPFNAYPVEYFPIFDELLHHMLKIFAPRGWPALNITHQEGTDWEHFMTQHALAEPALFLVRLLFASGDMIRLKVLDPKVAVWLRTLSIKAINEALSDPKRSLSDGMILAVGRIALTESLYGDRNAANIIHRPAQRRMIDLRGGMGAINFPPLVKRLMRWSDRVMSMQSNTPRLLLDDEDKGNSTFGMNESVKVLENWVPSEGRALRRKITISDLIT